MALSTLTVRDGNNAAQTIPGMADLAGNIASMASLDSSQQVYRAAANFTPTAIGAVTLITVTGSATKTVRIKRIGITGTSTAGGQFVYALQRTSALGAGGTLVAPTVGKLDTTSAAATAVVNHWTTTLKAAGTPVGGPLSTGQVVTVITTAATYVSASVPVFPEFGSPIGQAIVLRGTGDILEVQNLLPATLTGAPVLCYFVEWIEDAS